MVMATISTTLSALKTSVDMAKTAVGLRDDAKIAEATQLLNDRIIDVQNAALQLQEKLSTQRDEIEAFKDDKRELSAKIAELEKRKSEREQYKLHEITEGVFVLALVEGGDNGTPMHYICQSCMDNESKKVVLQKRHSSGRIIFRCPSCETPYNTGKSYSYSPVRFAGHD